jgi:hypothetical protein
MYEALVLPRAVRSRLGFDADYGAGLGFFDPPVLMELVLAPATAGDAVVVIVDTPVAEGPILDSRVFGPLDVAYVLHKRGSFNSLARGWAGGTSVTWGDDDVTCMRMAVATDSDADRDRLSGTFNRWLTYGDDRTVVIEGDLIVATTCAPHIP